MSRKKKIGIIASGIVILLITVIALLAGNYSNRLSNCTNKLELDNRMHNGYTMSYYEVEEYGGNTILLHLEKDGIFRYVRYQNAAIDILKKDVFSIEGNWTSKNEGYLILYKNDGTSIGYVFSTHIFLTIEHDDAKAISLKENMQYQNAVDNHYPELAAPISPVVGENMYKIKEDKVYVSYNKGKDFVEVPIPLTTLVSISEDHIKYNTLQAGSYVISKEKTAFVYGGTRDTVPSIIYSDDAGKTWQTTLLQLDTTMTNQVRVHYISFPTPMHGYVVLAHGIDKGREENYVLETTDGGNTWKRKNAFPTNHIVEFAGFTSETSGVLFARSVLGEEHMLYQTSDNAQTFTQIAPPNIEGYFLVPLCYEDFKIENGKITVYAYLQANDGAAQKEGTFTSEDNGTTWNFKEANSSQ